VYIYFKQQQAYHSLAAALRDGAMASPSNSDSQDTRQAENNLRTIERRSLLIIRVSALMEFVAIAMLCIELGWLVFIAHTSHMNSYV